MAEEEKPPVSEVKEPEVTEEKADSTEKKLEKLTVEEKQEDSAKFDPQSETKEEEEVREDEAVLDDDEIEENPAYIPKKGKYYMHDSRDEDGPGELDGKRSRADGAWSHDRYVDSWQQPKSKKQLVARYGFDIRYGETEEEASKNEQDVPKEIPSPSDERPVQRGRGRGRGSGAPRSFNQPREQYQRRSQEEHDSFEDDGEERGGSRRQRQTKPTVVRNVRGGRGQPMTNGRGSYRNQERPRGGGQRSGDVREDRREDMPPQKREDFMENHRRGAMRGAVQSRQFVRTVSSSNRFERGGRQSDSRQEMSDDRGGHEDRRPSRGITSRGRGRGGVRGASGGASEHRGSHGPSRTQDSQPRSGYTPRQEVVFFDHPAPSAASHQQSPVVYFDPASQQANRPLPPREKKIIEIKSPN